MKAELRKRVWQRAKERCEYCQMPQEFDALPFHIDHIVPLKHHGRTVTKNLALACYFCNEYKGPNAGGVEMQSGEVIRLFHPRKDEWDDHFAWQGPKLVGKTAIGSVTIDVLKINEPNRVVHRASLIEEGVFPPKNCP